MEWLGWLKERNIRKSKISWEILLEGFEHMKNKGILLVLLLGTLCVGCGKNGEKSQESSAIAIKESGAVTSTSKSSTTSSERVTESASKIDMDQYNKIIESYATFLQDTSVQQSEINSMAFLANQDFYTGVFHVAVDIDHNGTQELLFALKNKKGDYTLLDMYTISSENELLRLTNEKNQLNAIGERMVLVPLQDGTLYFKGSSGVDSQSYKLYEFNQKGTELSIVRESTNVEGMLTDIGEPLDLSTLKWESVKKEEADKPSNSGGLDVGGLMTGNYASISQSWINNAGDEISISGNIITFASGDTGELSAGGLKKENQCLVGSVSFGMTGARIAIAPKGVEYSTTLVSSNTDTTQDRLIIGQSISASDEVYYPVP